MRVSANESDALVRFEPHPEHVEVRVATLVLRLRRREDGCSDVNVGGSVVYRSWRFSRREAEFPS